METAKQALTKFLSSKDVKFYETQSNKGFFTLDERLYNVEFETNNPRFLAIALDALRVQGITVDEVLCCIMVSTPSKVELVTTSDEEIIAFTEYVKADTDYAIENAIERLQDSEYIVKSKLKGCHKGSVFLSKCGVTEKNGVPQKCTYLYAEGDREEDGIVFDSFLPRMQENENTSTFEFKKGTGAGFSTVAGMDELKIQIQRDYIYLLLFENLAKEYGIAPPNGMLLYGPPGCGKTFIAERTADATYMNYALVSPSDLGSSFLHGSEEKIRTLFKEAEEHAPCMLIFDEFDALCPARGTVGTEYQSEEINEFLVHLNNCASKGVYVIAMTNHPDRIDHAVLRKGRMDKCIYVSEPDAKTREKLFELSLKKRPCSQKIDCKRLALLTEHYSCSDIDYIVKEAARKCFEETISGCRRNRKRINQQVLEATIAETLPSVSAADIKKYEKTRLALNDREAITKGRRTIGF